MFADAHISSLGYLWHKGLNMLLAVLVYFWSNTNSYANIMPEEMLGRSNRFKTHLLSFIRDFIRDSANAVQTGMRPWKFIYTRSMFLMHELMNADSLRADHDSRFII